MQPRISVSSLLMPELYQLIFHYISEWARMMAQLTPCFSHIPGAFFSYLVID